MPLITESQAQARLGAPGLLPEAPFEGPRPDFLRETVPAALRLESTIGAILSNETPATERGPFGGFVAEPTFDFVEEVAGTDFEAQAARFALANSREEVEAIKRQIERERRDRETLEAAGALGLVAAFAAGTFDPINLLPVGGVAAATARGGGSLLRIAGQSARAGFLTSTAAEAVLQANQETRTGAESAVAIAGSTVLSGLLGPGGVLLVRGGKKLFAGRPEPLPDAAAAQPVREPEAAAAALEEELTLAPAGEPDPREPGFLRVPEEDLVRDLGSEAGEVGLDELRPGATAQEALEAALARAAAGDAFAEDVVRRGIGELRDIGFTPAQIRAGFIDAGVPARDIDALLAEGPAAAPGSVVEGPRTIRRPRQPAAPGAAVRESGSALEAPSASPPPSAPPAAPPALDPRVVARAVAFVENRRNRLDAGLLAEKAEVDSKTAQHLFAEMVRQGRIFITRSGELRRRARTGPLDALQFLAASGGIREDRGELKAMDAQRFIPGFGNLVRREGLPLDEAGLRLHQAGYFGAPGAVDRPSVAEVLDLLADALRGRKIFSARDLEEVEARRAELAAEEDQIQLRELVESLGQEAEAIGVKASGRELEDAVVLAHVEGIEPIDALAEILERRALETEELLDADQPTADRPGEAPPFEVEGRGAGGEDGGGAPGGEPGGPGEGQGAGGGGAGGRSLASEATPEGEQLLAPGVDPITERQRLEVEAAQPRDGGERPPPEGGLFDEDARAQGDIEDLLGPAPRPPEGGSTVGAAAATGAPTRAELQLKSALGLEKGLAFQDPLLRAASSPATATRRTMARLAEQPLSYEDNALGVATPVAVETRIKMWQAPLAEALRGMDEFFVRYRLGRAKRAGDVAAIGARDLFGQARREGAMSYKAFKVAVGRAMRRGDQAEVPEVAEAAKLWRERVFDPLKERATEAGFWREDPAVETAESYLMRLYDLELLAARRPQFIEIAGQWLAERRAAALRRLQSEELEGEALAQAEREAGRDDAELRDLAAQIADRISGTPAGRLPYDVAIPEHPGERQLGGRPGGALGSPLQGRAFLIEDLRIEEFLESDIEVIGRIYVRSMAPDVELAREFRSIDLAVEVDEIRRDYSRLAARETDERRRKRVIDRRDRDIKDLAAVRDRLRGVFALPADPNGIVNRTARAVLSLNYIRLLGGMTISAIPDLARPVMVHGVSRVFGAGLRPLIRNSRAFRLAGAEVQKAGTALDMINDARMMAIADVMDDFGRYSKLERGIQALSQSFGLPSLMAPWNSAMKQFSGVITMDRILEAAAAARGGRISAAELERLAASGIDAEMAGRIARQFEAHGEELDGIKLAQTEAWDDREAVEHFRAAVAREVDRIIVTPGQDRPLWISTPLGRVIGQFRSFSLASSQRIMLAGLQDRDAAALNGAMLSLGLGMLVYYAKTKTAGRELSDDPAVWIVEGVDRSGLTGWFFDVNAISEKMTRGVIGTSALTGGPTLSRYASRNVLGAIFGPSVGAIRDLQKVTAAGATGDIRQSDIRALRRLMPYQNLFYMRRLLDQAEAGVAAQLGVTQ